MLLPFSGIRNTRERQPQLQIQIRLGLNCAPFEITSQIDGNSTETGRDSWKSFSILPWVSHSRFTKSRVALLPMNILLLLSRGLRRADATWGTY